MAGLRSATTDMSEDEMGEIHGGCTPAELRHVKSYVEKGLAAGLDSDAVHVGYSLICEHLRQPQRRLKILASPACVARTVTRPYACQARNPGAAFVEGTETNELI